MMDFDAITIDTSVFNNFGLNLEHSALNAINTFSKNNIVIVIPDIIEREILSHLIADTLKTQTEALNKLEKLKKYNLLSTLETDNMINILKQNNVSDIVNDRWKLYKRLHKIEIIKSNDITVDELINDYFEKKPPFSEKKKAEFPDAIAMKTIKNWAEINNKKVLCFSTDSDWKDYVESVDNLQYSENITSVLGKLNSNIQLSEQIKNKIDWIFLAMQCSELGIEADKDTHLWEDFYEKLQSVLAHKSIEFCGNVNVYDYSIGLSCFDFPHKKYEILSYDEKEKVIDILIPMTLEYYVYVEVQSEVDNSNTRYVPSVDCSFDTTAIIQMDFKTDNIIQSVEITSNKIPVNLSLLKSGW